MADYPNTRSRARSRSGARSRVLSTRSKSQARPNKIDDQDPVPPAPPASPADSKTDDDGIHLSNDLLELVRLISHIQPDCHCLTCKVDMGPQNPRQLCGKTRCLYEDHEPIELIMIQVNNIISLSDNDNKKVRVDIEAVRKQAKLAFPQHFEHY